MEPSLLSQIREAHEACLATPEAPEYLTPHEAEQLILSFGASLPAESERKKFVLSFTRAFFQLYQRGIVTDENEPRDRPRFQALVEREFARHPAYGLTLSEDEIEAALDLYLKCLSAFPPIRKVLVDNDQTQYAFDLPHAAKVELQRLCIAQVRFDFPNLRLPEYTLTQLVRSALLMELSAEEVLEMMEELGAHALASHYYSEANRRELVEDYTVAFVRLYSHGLITKTNEPPQRPTVTSLLAAELRRRGLRSLSAEELLLCRETYMSSIIRLWNIDKACGTPKRRAKLPPSKLAKHYAKMTKGVTRAMQRDFPRFARRSLAADKLEQRIRADVDDVYKIYFPSG